MRPRIMMFIFALCLLVGLLALAGCEPSECPTDCTCTSEPGPTEPGPPPCKPPDAE
jgi:hypothetical protein